MRAPSRRVMMFVGAAVLLGAAVAVTPLGKRVFFGVVQRLRGRMTLEERIDEIGPRARERVGAKFVAAGVAYPPGAVVLVGLKEEKELRVYAGAGDGQFKFVYAYPVLAASGVAGPKLREGDRQVPEGFYRIELLNPNSSYHLSMRVSYPNEEDRTHAVEEGRSGLGGDIYIHGKAASVGCLAMGDEAIEELFVLVHEAGLEHVDVVLCPCDLRVRTPENERTPAWVGALYERLRERLAGLGE